MSPRLDQVAQAQLLRYAVRLHHYFRHEVAVLHGEVVVVMALLDLLDVLLATLIICIGLHRKELLETLTQIFVRICLYQISRWILRFISYEMRRLNLSVGGVADGFQLVESFVKRRVLLGLQ